MNDHLTFQPISNTSIDLRYAVWRLSLAGNLFALAIGVSVLPGAEAATSKSEIASRTLIAETYGQRPLSFEANRGQTDAQVKFLARGSGYSLFLTSTEAVLTLRKADPEHQPAHGKPPFNNMKPPKASSAAVLRMQLQGANARAAVTGLDELPGKTNYLRGKDPKAWRTGIPSYAKVKYAGVYPGVDLIYYGKQRQLEYDFVVAPGADPNTIRLRFDGAEQLSLDDNGLLVVKTASGEVIQHKPVIYQNVGGVRKTIAGGYMLYPDKNGKTSQIGFQVARYDASKTLTIDPVLGYSTYLGGAYPGKGGANSGELGYGIAVDSSGNAYVAGETFSSDFPIVNTPTFGSPHAYSGDAFVTKFDPTGTIIYSTVLGGGEYVRDVAYAIVADNEGNAYITGTSGNFSPSGSCIDSGFVTKISPDGASLVYTFCLPNSEGHAIALDRFGSIYVTGFAGSGFQTVNPAQPNFGGGLIDAFVAKLNPEGTALVYSTYLGGSGDNFERGIGIAVDRFGNAYVTGATPSTDFPAVHPLHACDGNTNAFVTKLNSAGTDFVFSTCLGGSDTNYSNGIALDRLENIYITGYTNSFDFPSVRPIKACDGSSAFLTKLNSTGTAQFYSTCFGGNNSDYGSGIAVDRFGNVYVTGETRSADFPTKRPLQPSCDSINGDAFVTKLNASGSGLVYSTCLGGASGNEFSFGIALDRFGNAYVTGKTSSKIDFPTIRAFQPSYGGGNNYEFDLSDAFVTKIVGN